MLRTKFIEENELIFHVQYRFMRKSYGLGYKNREKTVTGNAYRSGL